MMVKTDYRDFIGKKQTRTFTAGRAAIDLDARTVELSFSSAEPYERSFGIEILGHKSSEVTFPESVPLCVEHDTGRQIGVCEELRIGPDEVGRARARFSRRQEARDELQDIADGIRGKVSVGYIVNEMKLVEEKSDGPDVYRVTDWEVLEISIVTIPADGTVGVGKSKEVGVSDTEHKNAETPEVVEEPVVEAVEEAPAAEVTEPEVAPEPVEVKAAAAPEYDPNEILDVCEFAKKAGVRGAEDLAHKMIRERKSAAEYHKLLKEMDVDKEIKTPEIGLSPKEQRSYSMLRLMDALASPNDRKAQERAAFEFECSAAVAERIGKSPQGAFVPDDIQKRELTVGSATAGGNLVATDLMAGSFIELLRNRTVIAQAGAQFMTGLVGNVAIPKQTGGATAYWVTESADVTTSNQTVGQVTMSPKTVGAFTTLSRRLIKQATPSAEQFVINDLANTLAVAIDLGALAGSGASGQPTGITDDGNTDLGTVTFTSSGAPTFAEVAEVWAEVSKDNALMGSLAWLCDSAMAAYLMTAPKVASSAGNGFIMENNRILGYPVFITEQATANELLFGNFNDLIIGQWGVLDLLVDPYSSAADGTVGIYALQDVDVAIRHGQSFALGSGGS